VLIHLQTIGQYQFYVLRFSSTFSDTGIWRPVPYRAGSLCIVPPRGERQHVPLACIAFALLAVTHQPPKTELPLSALSAADAEYQHHAIPAAPTNCCYHNLIYISPRAVIRRFFRTRHRSHPVNSRTAIAVGEYKK